MLVRNSQRRAGTMEWLANNDAAFERLYEHMGVLPAFAMALVATQNVRRGGALRNPVFVICATCAIYFIPRMRFVAAATVLVKFW